MNQKPKDSLKSAFLPRESPHQIMAHANSGRAQQSQEEGQLCRLYEKSLEETGRGMLKEEILMSIRE